MTFTSECGDVHFGAHIGWTREMFSGCTVHRWICCIKMSLNSSHQIVYENIVLRPYRECHVPKYNAWMDDPWLREMTSSEETTLKEAYEIQEFWNDGEERFMFLIHSSDAIASALKDTDPQEVTDSFVSRLIPTQKDEIDTMCGDVNVVLLSDDDSGEDGKKAAELMVMVAEKSMRNRNIATHAVLAVMKYAHEQLNVDRFIVKVSNSNEASLNLFKNRLKFSILKEIPAFDETHLSIDFESIPQIELGSASTGSSDEAVDVYRTDRKSVV